MCDKIYFRSEQLATIHEAFNYFDVNRDGLISIDELTQLLGSLGILKITERSSENIEDDNFNPIIGGSKDIGKDGCVCKSDKRRMDERMPPSISVTDEKIIAELYLR